MVHDSPLNTYEVDLRSGMFVLRHTDLFVKDVMPLALTSSLKTAFQFILTASPKARAYTDAVYERTATASQFYKARFWWNGNGWTLRFADGTGRDYWPRSGGLEKTCPRWGLA